MSPEQIAEKVTSKLNNHPVDYLLSDADYHIANFLAFLDSKLSKPRMEVMINEWLETRDGARWYEKKVDQLFNNFPDGEDK